MEERDITYIGTKLKVNVHHEPIQGLTMDEYDFEVEFYCSSKKKLKYKKSELIRIDESNYVARVDTTIVGLGNLKCNIIANIPDGDFIERIRPEIEVIEGITTIVNLP